MTLEFTLEATEANLPNLYTAEPSETRRYHIVEHKGGFTPCTSSGTRYKTHYSLADAPCASLDEAKAVCQSHWERVLKSDEKTKAK